MNLLANDESLFERNVKEHLELCNRLIDLSPLISKAIALCAGSVKCGGKIMLCGNGGSAADSQHIASEFTGRLVRDRKPIAALALSTDSSSLTCISNDYSFSEVFARQLLAIGKPDDCLIGISTSGNSSNVIEAFKVAKEANIFTIGLLGRDGGKLKDLCDVPIIVPSSTTARIQEAHILIGHTICGGVEIELNLVSNT